MNYLKLDWANMASLKNEYIEDICRCFAQVYFSKQIRFSEEYAAINDRTPVTVKKNYWYCKSNFYRKLFIPDNSCLNLPVVKCSIKGKSFYLVESAKFYFTRRLRNIYLFEIEDYDIKKNRKLKDGTGVVFKNRDGYFNFFAPAVNLGKFY